ncbi:hypothetical protein KY285_031205 [Solanum tuberosum]|nr:hypothetical protein KY289_031335 [Solanum tuberosum]KAH0656323.1 hypothetical protein KY285_031205 [Solanum tuberosum]
MHTLALFIKVKRRNCRNVPNNWGIMVEALYTYSPTDKVTKVIWKPPDTGWVKVNTDGASKAQAKEIEELSCTNTQPEAMAILRGLKKNLEDSIESGDYIGGDMETDARQNNDHNSHSQGSK